MGVETEPELGPGHVWAPLRQLTCIPWEQRERGWGQKSRQGGVDQHHSTVLSSGRAEMNSRLMGSLSGLTDPSLCSAGLRAVPARRCECVCGAGRHNSERQS